MLVSAMRSRSVSSFGYARTSRSGEPFALDSRVTANRTLENWSNALIISLVSPLLFWPKYPFAGANPIPNAPSALTVPCLESRFLNQRVTCGKWRAVFGFVMKPVERAHCNLEFPLFCHPSDGPLVKIVTLYWHGRNNLRNAPRGSQKHSHRVRFHLRSNLGRARRNDAAVERSDRMWEFMRRQIWTRTR